MKALAGESRSVRMARKRRGSKMLKVKEGRSMDRPMRQPARGRRSIPAQAAGRMTRGSFARSMDASSEDPVPEAVEKMVGRPVQHMGWVHIAATRIKKYRSRGLEDQRMWADGRGDVSLRFVKGTRETH